MVSTVPIENYRNLYHFGACKWRISKSLVVLFSFYNNNKTLWSSLDRLQKSWLWCLSGGHAFHNMQSTPYLVHDRSKGVSSTSSSSTSTSSSSSRGSTEHFFTSSSAINFLLLRRLRNDCTCSSSTTRSRCPTHESSSTCCLWPTVGQNF